MIRRAARPETGYLMVRNDVVRDTRLSFRARGLLCAMLSYPDDWRFDRTWLASQGAEGESAVRTALTELENAGYLHRRKTKTADGKFGWEHTLYDIPQIDGSSNPAGHTSGRFPADGNPEPDTGASGGFPTTGNHPSYEDLERTPVKDPQPTTPSLVEAPATPKRRATRIPKDFTLTHDMRAWTREHTPHVDAVAELLKFIDYWTAKSGQNATKLDWMATWRNWMRKAAEYTGHRPAHQQPLTGPGGAPMSSLSAADGLPLPVGTGNSRMTDAMRLAAHFAVLDGEATSDTTRSIDR